MPIRLRVLLREYARQLDIERLSVAICGFMNAMAQVWHLS